MTTTPHGPSRYKKGCRCDECRAGNRTYQRRYRARRVIRAVPDAQGVTEQPSTPPSTVVDAVTAQLDDLGATQARPALAAVAVKLAELLDNPHALPQHPQAAGRLCELLVKLTREQRRGGRLAAVRGMTGRSD